MSESEMWFSGLSLSLIFQNICSGQLISSIAPGPRCWQRSGAHRILSAQQPRDHQPDNFFLYPPVNDVTLSQWILPWVCRDSVHSRRRWLFHCASHRFLSSSKFPTSPEKEQWINVLFSQPTLVIVHIVYDNKDLRWSLCLGIRGRLAHGWSHQSQWIQPTSSPSYQASPEKNK